MSWYHGPTLLNYLETVSIADTHNLTDLRLPIQLVLRPNLNFRGFAGTIASGILKKGDIVRALPSGKTSRIKSIITYDGEKGGGLDEAFAPMSIVVTLDDEIDVSRGDMLVHATPPSPDNPAAHPDPSVASDIDAMIVWMHEKPFVPGKTYWIKQTSRIVT